MNSINKIKILSPEQAIKIAAGEVVERPANIIKEIIENSIDAGATKITLIIHQAGKLLIKIIDNGMGMTPDDAKLSVAQHATSKITSIDDLETIATFGFRGEALASINAVSNLTITTKTNDAQTGTKISWNFGKLVEESLQSHPTGTTLEIANLFDNIPARQKFLKKDETEWRAIVTLFQAFCLDYCNIHFQLYNEDKLQFNCPAVTKLSDRTAQIFDLHLQEKIINLIDLKNNLCSVTGIISHSNYYRYDRNQIFIFVNNRWVKNIDLTKAIMRGYAGTLPAQKYPAAIIFITIDADQIDVNIHPKKEEVKFLHPKKVETIIVNSIKATLEESTTQQLQQSKSTTFIPAFGYQQPFIQNSHVIQNYDESTQESQNITPDRFSFLQPSFKTVDVSRQTTQPFHNSLQDAQLNHETSLAMPDNFATHIFENHSMQNNLEELSQQDEQVQLIPDEQFELSIIGQYKLTYILFEKDNNLVFIDQHAAHERILYEQFKSNFDNVATIQLIFPEFIKLQAQDVITITPYLSLLKTHGIDAEVFSDTQLIVQATPVHLKNQLLQETIQQIIGWISQIDETDPARINNLLNEKIHTKMACSAAIKAGDALNLEQMQQLLQNLRKIEHRFSCPHGRPTFWILPIDHLEKQFKRDYGKKAEQFYDFL
ncbi:MAG: DNA mismatch repair endonuclease MutL [Candidatus Dependentiae bacterium]|nr:DNA mismatch repair endonuclease MutL [Candidatus Dependentiae bacterium]